MKIRPIWPRSWRTGTALLAASAIVATGSYLKASDALTEHATARTVAAVGNTQITGTVRAVPTVTIRSGPGTTYSPAATSSAPTQAVYNVMCYAEGTTETGWGGTNNYWDYVADQATGQKLGYIADVWLDTRDNTAWNGQITQEVPRCGDITVAPQPQPNPPSQPSSGCGPEHTATGGYTAAACLSLGFANTPLPDAYVTVPDRTVSTGNCEVTVASYVVGGSLLGVSTDGTMFNQQSFPCQAGKQHYSVNAANPGNTSNAGSQAASRISQLLNSITGAAFRATVVVIDGNGNAVVSADSPAQGGNGGAHGTAATAGGPETPSPAPSGSDHIVNLTCSTAPELLNTPWRGLNLTTPGILRIKIPVHVNTQGLVTAVDNPQGVSVQGVQGGVTPEDATGTGRILDGGRAVMWSGSADVLTSIQAGPVSGTGVGTPVACDSYFTQPFTDMTR